MADTPKRIQLRRTKGWRKPEGAIVVARPSKWGNPYKVGDIVLDPVNEHNPIPSVLTEVSPFLRRVGSTVERTSVRGDPYSSEVRRIVETYEAVEMYRRWIEFHDPDLSPLRDHDLACWCNLCPTTACHADILLELANR